MKEKTLVKVCVISVLVGILIMVFANKLIVSKEIKISEISEDYNYVKVKGNVTEVHESKSGTLFFKLNDETGSVDVIVFKGSVENTDIENGCFVEVIGKPEKYKGKMEIIASQIIR